MVRAFFLTIIVFLTGCVLPPTEQFLRYDEAFDKANEASKTVLSVYSQYEKELYPLDPNSFRPDQAALISASAPGPLTALYSRGFSVVEKYNAILYRYAQGDSVSVLSDDITALNAASAQLGLVLGVADTAARLSGAVAAAQRLVGIGLALSDAEEFDASLAEGGVAVRQFLGIVREDTADMYQDVSTAMLRRIQRNPSNLAQEQENRAQFRDMLAAWVLLIDETIAELERLEVAVAAGARSPQTISNVSNSIARITQYSEDIRFARRQIAGLF